jgi:hypothetical protein
MVYAPQISVSVSAVDARGLDDYVEHEFGPRFIGLIEDHARDFNERLFAAAPRRRS